MDTALNKGDNMTEEIVVNTPVVADTTSTESTPVETTSEVVDEQAIADKEIAESLKETDGKDETQVEVKADETEQKPQGKAEERKQQLNSEIRDLVSQRNTLKAQVEQANAQVYQPATETELLEQINPETGESYNRLEAKLAAMEQQAEMSRYNNQVAETQLTITSEVQGILKDFPMFDSQNKETYNPEIAAQADRLLAANLVYDPNTNQIIGSHVSPYELYKTIADAAKISSINGQIKGQKAVDQMQSRTDTTSSAAPTKSSEDDLFLKGLQGK